MRIVVLAVFLLAWRNWQTRTAQDRMGQPVEVRVLSRASYRALYYEQRAIRAWVTFQRLFFLPPIGLSLIGKASCVPQGLVLPFS